MENFKEFTGKDLDDAIAEACAYFDTQREQLEVEIIQDAKSGIFGLVGARKAMIKAKRAKIHMPLGSVAPKPEIEKKKEKAQKATKPPKQEKNSEIIAEKSLEEKQEKALQEKPKQEKIAPANAPQEDISTKQACNDEVCSDDDGDTQRVPFEQLDQVKLKEVSYDVISKLILPIVGMAPIEISFQDARVCISLDCGEDSGLLIGREGQTLASLQYIASRIISREMQASVRVQLDTGDYRTRQDEKLRELVLYLAERVRTVGRSHSTRPLSSYHRRIVHLVLQDCPDLITRSSGDGPLKRVIIQRKRGQQ